MEVFVIWASCRACLLYLPLNMSWYCSQSATFSQPRFLRSLPLWKYGFYKYPHGPSRRVNASNDTETQPLLYPRPFFELHIMHSHARKLMPTRYFTIFHWYWFLYGTINTIFLCENVLFTI